MRCKKNSVSVAALGALAKRGTSRRAWLQQGIAVGLSVVFPAFGKNAPPSITAHNGAISDPLSSLNALVDTLIPADHVTPSASALGIGNILLEQASSDAVFRPWLVEGMKWLDQGVAGSFVLRTEQARGLLLERLANSATGSQTRTFFEFVRLRTMTAYYADPRSWSGLATDRPPQPLGYRDFADPE